MRRSSRTKMILGVATALALTTAGWLGTGAAVADDTPAPSDTSVPSDSPSSTPDPSATDTPIDPGFTPQPFVHPKPTGGHPDGFNINPDTQALTPITTANNFANAALLSYPNKLWPYIEFNSTGATTQSGEPRKLNAGYYLYRTMWAKWKAPMSGYVSVAAYAGSSDDTGVNVYTGTKFSNLKRVAFNDQQYQPVDGSNLTDTTASTPSNGAQILSLKVTAGKWYYFQVGNSQYGASAVPGTGYTDLTLEIQANRYLPGNDFLANATPLKFAAGSSATFKSRAVYNGATIEGWEPTDNKDATSNLRTGSVWYQWTAPQTGIGIFSACETLAYPSVAVFSNYLEQAGSGVGYGDLASVAWGYNNASSTSCPEALTAGSTAVWTAYKGQTYFIQASNTSGLVPANEGIITLQEAFFQPYIDKLSMTSGKPGNTVTISGFALGGSPVVKFGTKTATIVGSPTATSIVVKVPSQGGKKGNVYVSVTSSTNVSNLVTFKYK